MDEVAIKVVVKGQECVMMLNMNLFRVLGREWGFDTLPETAQRLSLIEKLEAGSFEAYDVLFDLLYWSIACNKDNPEISRNTIDNLGTSELLNLGRKMIDGLPLAFNNQNPDADPEKKIPAPKKKKPGTT